MKIIGTKSYNMLEHVCKVKTNVKYLKEPINSEQAKKEKIGLYMNVDLHYVIGREEAKFAFLDLVRVPVYSDDGKVSEFFYEVDVLVGDKVYTVRLAQDEFVSEKWLRQLKVGDVLTISKNNYQKLLGAISPREGKVKLFNTLGIHGIEGQLYYVASDCAISREGICHEFKSLQDGFNLICDQKKSGKELARKFMEYNSMNLRVFYPFHCIAVMSVLRYFLRERGKRGGAVLWVDGEVASGKTELAITLGNFFYRGNSRDLATEHMYTTKIKVNELENELVKYQGSVFILDDVKREESTRNKENTKNVTDLLVRSIYEGKVGNNRVNAMAIITGEYFKEQKSTTSRVLYLNISSFLQNEKNSADLKKLQSDPDYYTEFMISFIQWFLGKMEDDNYKEDFVEKVENIFSEPIHDVCWSGKELSARMQETYANFAVCTEVVGEYLTEVLGGASEGKIKGFISDCKAVILDLIEETWYRSLDYEPILDMAFQRVLPKLKIKDCRYGENYLEASDASTYLDFNKGRRGISFSESCLMKHKLWLVGYTEEYAGILLNLYGKEVLLLSVKKTSGQIFETVETMMKDRKLPFYPSDYTEKAVVTSLLNGHKILAEKRNDSGFNRIINYPITYYEDDSYDNPTIRCNGTVQMVKVNLDVPYDIIGSLEHLEMSPVQDWISARRILRKLGETGGNQKAMDEALKNVDKFLDLK